MIEEAARMVLGRLGVEGVSTAALILLVALALYAHKASKAGRLVAGAGSTVAHDAMVVAVVLAVLLLSGVFIADVERGRDVIRTLRNVNLQAWFEQVVRWVS